MEQDVLVVEADVITLEAFVAPEDHLTPQVGVWSTLVHGSVRLEVLHDVVFVFGKESLVFFVSGLWVPVDFVEVSSDSVLLVMESIEVNSLDGVNVLRLQSTEHTFVKSSDSLVSAEHLWVFDGVGKQVVDLLEAEVFAIVVRFGHY